MLIEYAYVGLFFLAALLVAAGMMLIPVILKLIGLVPKKPNAVKNSTFECGMETIGKTQVRFNFRYYFYALMFVTLDVIVLFIYPWAVSLHKLGYLALGAMIVFLVLIMVGFLYAWKKKVLEWK